MSDPAGGSDFRISLKLLWGTRERPTRGPKPGLSVERIVQAAIELADEDGLDALSMRRVAERLGVGAMSLYRYVPSKAELLDLMLDTIHAEDAGELPDADWRARVEWLARRSRALIERHPWMLGVSLGQRPPLGPNIIAAFEVYLQAISGIGLSPAEMVAATELVSNYVHGATRAAVESAETERRSGVTDVQWWEERASFWEEYFEPERFPALSEVYAGGAYDDPIDAFEFGLQRILDGIEALLAGR